MGFPGDTHYSFTLCYRHSLAIRRQVRQTQVRRGGSAGSLAASKAPHMRKKLRIHHTEILASEVEANPRRSDQHFQRAGHAGARHQASCRQLHACSRSIMQAAACLLTLQQDLDDLPLARVAVSAAQPLRRAGDGEREGVQLRLPGYGRRCILRVKIIPSAETRQSATPSPRPGVERLLPPSAQHIHSASRGPTVVVTHRTADPGPPCTDALARRG